MPKQLPRSPPEISRIRAAAALIPIIEAGLADSQLSVERAAPMAAFCDWTVEQSFDDPSTAKLAETVDSGLKRIKMVLSSTA